MTKRFGASLDQSPRLGATLDQAAAVRSASVVQRLARRNQDSLYPSFPFWVRPHNPDIECHVSPSTGDVMYCLPNDPPVEDQIRWIENHRDAIRLAKPEDAQLG